MSPLVVITVVISVPAERGSSQDKNWQIYTIMQFTPQIMICSKSNQINFTFQVYKKTENIQLCLSIKSNYSFLLSLELLMNLFVCDDREENDGQVAQWVSRGSNLSFLNLHFRKKNCPHLIYEFCC